MITADHLSSPRSIKGIPYEHHGIYIGKRKVIHYSGFSNGLGSKPDGEICEASVKEFESGEGSQVVRYTRSFAPEEVLRRAHSCLGECDYNLVRNNCEHFAVWCKTGRLVSHQCDRVVRTASLVPIDLVKAPVLLTSIWADVKAIGTVIDRHRRLRRGLRAEERRLRSEAERRLTELRLELSLRVAELRRRLRQRDAEAASAVHVMHERNRELVALLRTLRDHTTPNALPLVRSINTLLELT